MLGWTIFFGITTIIGVICTIYYGKKSASLEKAKKKLEWTDLMSCTSDLAAKIKNEFEPDLIFTPGLRGATIVNLLINELNLFIPVYVGICIWKEGNDQFVNPPNYQLIETNKWYIFIPDSITEYSENRILIVDDFAMSGDFLEKLISHLLSNGFSRSNIKTLCSATTKIAVENHKAPDYYWFESTDTNFYFPWGKAK